MCAMPVQFDPLLYNPPAYQAQAQDEPEVEIRSTRWKAQEMYFIADAEDRVHDLFGNVISAKKRESEDYTDLMTQTLRQRELACKWVVEAGKFAEQLKEAVIEIKEQTKQPASVRLATCSDEEEKKFALMLEQKRNVQKAMNDARRRCQEYYNQRCTRRRPDGATLQQVAGALALPKGALEEFLQQNQATLPNMDQEACIVKAICNNMDEEWKKVCVEMTLLRQSKTTMNTGMVSAATSWVFSNVSWAWNNTPALSHIFAKPVFPGEPVELKKTIIEPEPTMPVPSAPEWPCDGPIEVSYTPQYSPLYSPKKVEVTYT